jgi:hypothetical protein
MARGLGQILCQLEYDIEKFAITSSAMAATFNLNNDYCGYFCRSDSVRVLDSCKPYRSVAYRRRRRYSEQVGRRNSRAD